MIRGQGPRFSVGTALGHYRATEKIGDGAMGEVYRARDERLGRDVAIKVLAPGILADEAARRRFRREARTLSRLNHPNIAILHHFETERDLDYLVMEYVPGETLRTRIEREPLQTDELASVGAQIGQGLAAAHAQGLVHCDLKPENVLVTPDGRVKILDFGVAKLVRPHADVTSTADSEQTTVAGTLPYMSPEQLLGKKLDPRSDVFSLGVVLYEMATGSRPFRGSTTSAISEAILHDEPVRPLHLNPSLPPAVEAIILKALEKDPDLRYQQARDVVIDLQRLARGASVPAPSLQAAPAESPSFSPRRRRARLVAALAGVAAVVLAAGFWWSQRLQRPSVDPSIAVLPFVDMSADRSQEYFSDGLSEELLNTLARTPGLRVVGRTSSFRFKGKADDLRSISQQLHVATILEGSVRRAGKRVRITAQLVSGADGFHLWSETYDRKVDDIFAVQDEIAASVASALEVTLLRGTQPTSQTTDPEAYNAYLLGAYYQGQVSQDMLEKAAESYEKATRLDPRYAAAWAGLGATRVFQAVSGFIPADEGFRQGRQAAQRALAVDERLGQAHAVMGWVYMSHDWDWAAANVSFQRAAKLDPSRPPRDGAILSVALGQVDEGLALARRVVEQEPLDPRSHYVEGLLNYYAGRLDEAAADLKRVFAIGSSHNNAHALLGQVYLAQSRPEQAIAEVEQEKDEYRRLPSLALVQHALGHQKESDAALSDFILKYQGVGAYEVAGVYAYRGQADEAMQWLERAYAQRDGGLFLMKADPLFKTLHDDPRYQALLKRIRLS